MKTITMDFDVYKQDLVDARMSAAKNAPALIQKIDTAVAKIGSGTSTYDEFHHAIRLLREVRDSLKGVEE